MGHQITWVLLGVPVGHCEAWVLSEVSAGTSGSCVGSLRDLGTLGSFVMFWWGRWDLLQGVHVGLSQSFSG